MKGSDHEPLRAAVQSAHDIEAAPREQQAEDEPPYARQTELDAVDEFVRNSHFGVVGKHVVPFTRQVMREAARFFPIDREYYKEIDKLLGLAHRRAIILRLATFFLFLVFTLIAALLITGNKTVCQLFPTNWFSWAPPMFFPMLAVICAGVALAFIRFVIRWEILSRLEGKVTNIKNSMKAQHTALINECINVANDISHIERPKTWPHRAEKSAKVALWFALRADYLDRYITTVLWKIETSFQQTEQFFWGAKAVVAGCFVVFVARSVSTVWAPALATAAYLATALVGWIFVYRRNNDFIGLIFNPKQESSARMHYFDAIATEIKNLVILAVEHMRR